VGSNPALGVCDVVAKKSGGLLDETGKIANDIANMNENELPRQG